MALLRHRDFLLLFAGQGVSRLGDGLYTAVVAWLAWSLTHEPGAVALVTVAAYGPAFLATLIGASYADRYDRRRLMIATDVVRAAVVAVAPVLLALGLLNLTLLVAGAALLALIGAPFAPARNAIVAQIVPTERLLEANGLLQVAFRAAFFVGPLLLAPLLAVASLQVVLALDVLTFLTSAATLAAIRVRPTARPGQRIGLRADLAAGLAALRAEPDVLIVIATFVLALVTASGFLTVGVVALVGESFGGHSGEYGLLLGIAGVAEVFGALALARLPLRNLALTAVLAWALLGAFRFPLGLAETPIIAAVLLAVTGFASALTDIPLIALVQQRIPDRHLAKALGLWEAGIAGALAVAPFAAAAIIGHVGVRNAFMLSGAALIGLAAIAAITITRVTATPVAPADRRRPASATEGTSPCQQEAKSAPLSGIERCATLSLSGRSAGGPEGRRPNGRSDPGAALAQAVALALQATPTDFATRTWARPGPTTDAQRGCSAPPYGLRSTAALPGSNVDQFSTGRPGPLFDRP